MSKQVLFVDIDGVMAESLAHWLVLYNQDHGTNFKKTDVTGYDTRECIGVDLSPYFLNYHTYDGVQPVEGAFESVSILRERYRIVFATIGNGRDWLTKRCSYRPEIAQLPDKSLLRGFGLIDDHPINLDGFVGERFLLSQPWNTGRGLNDTTWPLIVNYLMNL